eukprot:TRINITY_DN3764_c0_g1_i1.p1 TRINITY_DN3764_c0_g1~~TRINITY_DN3764_c0_g1_i1.p1  ORF type:complete len:100 (+),score=7.90 TRINITY_DN3764_c0_g1_i1:69-368(+)
MFVLFGGSCAKEERSSRFGGTSFTTTASMASSDALQERIAKEHEYELLSAQLRQASQSLHEVVTRRPYTELQRLEMDAWLESVKAAREGLIQDGSSQGM